MSQSFNSIQFNLFYFTFILGFYLFDCLRAKCFFEILNYSIFDSLTTYITEYLCFELPGVLLKNTPKQFRKKYNEYHYIRYDIIDISYAN